MVEEQLVEDTTRKTKKRGKVKVEDLSKPDHFEDMTIDLACAVYMKEG
jgi:hypothetical protein